MATGYYATFFETNKILWHQPTSGHIFNEKIDASLDDRSLFRDHAPEQFEPPEMEGYEHKLCSIYDLHIEGVYDITRD